MARHAPHPGVFETAVPGLSLIRADDPGMPMPTVYEPSLCIIGQGAKTVSLGERMLHYDPVHCLVASVDLAMVGQVTAATPDHPYLCCKIDIDQSALAELVLADGSALPPGDPPPLAVHPSGPDLLDAAFRLLRLLDRPASIPVLAPLVRREILHHLLTGPQGAMLRHAASGDSHLGQVGRAVGWIRRHAHQQLRIREVAGAARMSVSSLHHHFKRITGLTPLQFQKQLRLQAARQMMVAEGLSAGSAGFAVGYDSPSQFSREYRRLFGASPRADVSRVGGAGFAHVRARPKYHDLARAAGTGGTQDAGEARRDRALQ